MENLWIDRGKPVDLPTMKKSSSTFWPETGDRTNGRRASYAASLVSRNRPCESLSSFAACSTRHAHLTVTHRYEQHIAGRTYQIEVRPVAHARWRAQIARLPGMPTSMMPFYGATPDEAAQELSRWLTLVYNGNKNLPRDS